MMLGGVVTVGRAGVNCMEGTEVREGMCLICVMGGPGSGEPHSIRGDTRKSLPDREKGGWGPLS